MFENISSVQDFQQSHSPRLAQSSKLCIDVKSWIVSVNRTIWVSLKPHKIRIPGILRFNASVLTTSCEGPTTYLQNCWRLTDIHQVQLLFWTAQHWASCHASAILRHLKQYFVANSDQNKQTGVCEAIIGSSCRAFGSCCSAATMHSLPTDFL